MVELMKTFSNFPCFIQLTCISTSVVDGFCEVDEEGALVLDVDVVPAPALLLPLPIFVVLELLDGCIVEFDMAS